MQDHLSEGALTIPVQQWAFWIKAEVLWRPAWFNRTWNILQAWRPLLICTRPANVTITWHFTCKRRHQRQLFLTRRIAFRIRIKCSRSYLWWAHWSCFCLGRFCCGHVSRNNRRASKRFFISKWILLPVKWSSWK